jgi:non-ribosomal peptide synthetase component F
LDATLFVTLLAAWQTLLHLYSGQSDIVIATPIANRYRAETEALIGLFVNAVALRTNLGGDPTFAEVVERVQETALGAYAHQSLSFAKLMEELQSERDTPLVQVMFALQNVPHADLAALELEMNFVEQQTETTKFDLVIDMQENDEGLSLSLRYSTDLFDASTMQRLAHDFEELLVSLIGNANNCISELPRSTINFASKVRESFLDTVIRSGSDLVNDRSQKSLGYRMRITAQVATAPCTDRVQAEGPTFEAKLQRY